MQKTAGRPVKMVGRHAGFAARDAKTLHLEQFFCISDSKTCMSATQFPPHGSGKCSLPAGQRRTSLNRRILRMSVTAPGSAQLSTNAKPDQGISSSWTKAMAQTDSPQSSLEGPDAGWLRIRRQVAACVCSFSIKGAATPGARKKSKRRASGSEAAQIVSSSLNKSCMSCTDDISLPSG